MKFSYETGLTESILENFHMQIKSFFELNTHLEQRAMFKDVMIWDQMCDDRNIHTHLKCVKEHFFQIRGTFMVN